jgi:hypothetical protein
MLSPEDIANLRQFIETLGCPWSRSRFAVYEKALLIAQGLAGKDDPFFADDERANGRRAITLDGVSQLFQLRLASDVFSRLNQPLLKRWG